MRHTNETCTPLLTVSFLVLVISLSIIATPVFATSSSVQNAASSSGSAQLAPGSGPVMQYANDTGQFLGLGWLPEDIPADARETPVYAAALPTHFDWRNNNGYNWITSVKDQGGCGSCVAFAAVGATEAQYRIAASNPGWGVDLSEQHLFSCGGGQCGYGWYISAALNRLRDHGTPDEACFPYRARDTSCSGGCADWQSRASKIASWSWIAENPSAIEAALMNGPVVAAFDVYTDFFSYTNGVYRYDGQSPYAGGHAVVIVGYDSVDRYWIVKNSWGASWGDTGYFKIGFGECEIENWVASIRVSAPANSVTLTFYSDQASGTITADSTTKTNGESGTYNVNQRVHVVANSPSGYQFSYWETSGVSVDNVSSADTYLTVSSSGWLKAHFVAVSTAAKILGVTVVPDPSGVDQGTKITFTVTAQNPGSSAISSARVQLRIFKPDGKVASSPSKTITRFLAGSSRIVQITYSVSASAPTGDWTYGVYLYRSSTLLDQNTDGGFRVRVPSGIIVSVMDSPDPVTRKGTATFTITIKNTGNLVWSSAKITVKVYKPDGRLASTQTITLRNVQPGIEYTATKNWRVPSSGPTGSYRYDVYLAYRSATIASNTGNTITIN